MAQRAFGDADALSVGELSASKMVGWTLVGRPLDDAGMIELLEPMRPHLAAGWFGSSSVALPRPEAHRVTRCAASVQNIHAL